MRKNVETYLKPCQIYLIEIFYEYSKQLLAVNQFVKKCPPHMFDGVLDAPMKCFLPQISLL